MTAIDTDVKAVQKMFDVNVFGPMRMVHHFHEMIIKSRGTIVNIGSIGGIVPYLYGCKSTFFFLVVSSLTSSSLPDEKHLITLLRRHWFIGETRCVWKCLHWGKTLRLVNVQTTKLNNIFSVKVINVCLFPAGYDQILSHVV